MSTYTGVPQRTNRETSIDLIGQLIDLYRLPGESLVSFKARILDQYVNRSNCSYGGLINGINRELDLDAQTTGILVDIRRDADGLPLNKGLGISITSRYCSLYSDHVGGAVSHQFDLHDRADSYFLTDLLSHINAITSFEAVMVGTDNFDLSSHLENLSSLRLRLKEPTLAMSKMHRLYSIDTGNFIVGDLVFDQKTGLTEEVLSLPTQSQQFMVDYDYGVVWTSRFIEGTISYRYQRLPLFIRMSPISLYRFKDPEYLTLVTEQILDEDSNVVNGIPTVEGADKINELLGVVPMYWGE